ncbi:hypothetical protein PR048_007044 [Dryococelus australis]|uniref:Uncharacterized protein n=1 Tax=Dryococelus australis TaxID=614101 RepID=A0ABQ9ICI9_9NEOP|nr:hypothetical protein PR048_007044 [Dryococelus australis]
MVNPIGKDRKRTRRPENFGPLIRTKAEQFASDLGKMTLRQHWLDGWSVCSESGDIDVQVANDWQTDLL